MKSVVQAPMNWLQQNAAELIDIGLKILLAAAATFTVVWQLRKQHGNSLTQQRENARQALMLRIYETLVLRIRTLSDANSEAKMYASRYPWPELSLGASSTRRFCSSGRIADCSYGEGSMRLIRRLWLETAMLGSN
jgi:hypothetical protein